MRTMTMTANEAKQRDRSECRREKAGYEMPDSAPMTMFCGLPVMVATLPELTR